MAINFVPCLGGVNTVGAKGLVPEGSLADCLNYDVSYMDGYSRIDGFERIDGRNSGSNSEFYTFETTSSGAGWIHGESVEWAVGGVTRIRASLVHRDFSGSPEVNHIVLLYGEAPPPNTTALSISGGTITVSSVPVSSTTLTADEWETARALQIVDYLAAVVPVPGQGPPHASFEYKGDLYAISDVVPLAFTSGGTDEPVYWDDLSIQKDGSTVWWEGKLVQIDLDSGTWAAGTAAGTLWVMMGRMGDYTLDADEDGLGSFVYLLRTGNEICNITSPDLSAHDANNTIGAMLYKTAAVGSQYQVKGGVPTGVSYRTGWVDAYHNAWKASFTGGALEPSQFLNLSKLHDTTQHSTFDTGFIDPMTTSDAWTNSDNLLLDDGNDATDTIAGASTSATLDIYFPAFQFDANFSVEGVTVQIKRHALTSAVALRDNTVSLVFGNSSENKADTGTDWPTTEGTVTYGGPTDKWSGTAWAEDHADLWVRIKVDNLSGSPDTAHIQSVTVKVHLKGPDGRLYVWDSSGSRNIDVIWPTYLNKTSGHWVEVSVPYDTPINGWQDVAVGDTLYIWTNTATYRGGCTLVEKGDDTILVLIDTTTPLVVAHFTNNALITKTKESAENPSISTGQLLAQVNGTGTITNDAAGDIGFIRTISKQTTIKFSTYFSDHLFTGYQLRNLPDGNGDLVATLGSNQTFHLLPSKQQLLAAGAQYESVRKNFYGFEHSESLYLASGAGPAVCFSRYTRDGWTLDPSTASQTADLDFFTPIYTHEFDTDPTTDAPTHIIEFSDQLAFGYTVGRVILSSIGEPLTFDPSLEAASIPAGSPVYGLMDLYREALGIFTRDSIKYITIGNGSLEDAVLKTMKPNSGILEYSLRFVGGPMFMDYHGVGTIEQTENFGDFAFSYLSSSISDWIADRVQKTGSSDEDSNVVIGAGLMQAKNQYRAFFRDGNVLSMTLSGAEIPPEFTFQRYSLDANVTAMDYVHFHQTITDQGRARTFMCTNDSRFVYELDRGESFDDNNVVAYLEFNPLTQASVLGPQASSIDKDWGRFHVHGVFYTNSVFSWNFSTDFKALTPGYAISYDLADAVPFPEGAYQAIDLQVNGSGRALTARIDSSSKTERPHTIQALVLMTAETNLEG